MRHFGQYLSSMWQTAQVLPVGGQKVSLKVTTIMCPCLVLRSPDTLPETQPWSWWGSPQWDGACSPRCRPACAKTVGREWRWRAAQGHLDVCEEEGRGRWLTYVLTQTLWCSLKALEQISLTFVKEGDVVVLYRSEVNILSEIRLLWGVRRQ